MEVGAAVGKVLAIVLRDKDGDLVEFIRVRALLDTKKPLRRIVNMVGKYGKELLCLLKYKGLPVYCYICGKIGHNILKYPQYSKEIRESGYQYENWLRVNLTPQGQGSGLWRNRVEIISDKEDRGKARNRRIKVGERYQGRPLTLACFREDGCH